MKHDEGSGVARDGAWPFGYVQLAQLYTISVLRVTSCSDTRSSQLKKRPTQRTACYGGSHLSLEDPDP